MAIYTKTGDAGKTSVFGGRKMPKFDPQIEATGAIDESTSFIGFAIESMDDSEDISQLSSIQMTLYSIMGYLAGADIQEKIITQETQRLEATIDHLDVALPKITRFILPQGSETASRLHLARVTVRSAERRIVQYIDVESQTGKDKIILQYINRLSDYLFMMARKYTPKEKKT